MEVWKLKLWMRKTKQYTDEKKKKEKKNGDVMKGSFYLCRINLYARSFTFPIKDKPPPPLPPPSKVMLMARIPLSLSRHPSLPFITTGKLS